MSSTWCVVVAGGSGSRFGGWKQLERLGGRRVIDWAVSAARDACDGVVVVLPAELAGSAVADVPGADLVVAGGASRVASARAGLAVVPEDAEVVLVHDAARPLASAAVFRRVIEAVRAGAQAVVPVVPVTDTVRTLEGEVVDRSRLRAVQTPQGFPAGVLRAAHDAAAASGLEATDDAAVVATTGARVVMVDGEVTNVKITSPADLGVAAALLGSVAAAAERRGPRCG